MADLTVAVGQSHAEAPHQTGYSATASKKKRKLPQRPVQSIAGKFDSIFKFGMAPQVYEHFLQTLAQKCDVDLELVESPDQFQAGGQTFIEVACLKFDPTQQRGPDGKWVKEEYDTHTFFHGTAEQYLADILKQGLLVGHAGEIWPMFSHRDAVYMTTDQEDAFRWAGQAAEHAARQYDGTHMPSEALPLNEPSAVILKIRVPDEYASRVRTDANFSDAEPQRQFEGNIPPSWIVGAKVGTLISVRSQEGFNKNPNDFIWKDIPLPKKAEDGQILYVVVLLNQQKNVGMGGLTQKFDPALHPKGPDGRFIEAGAPRVFNKPSDIEEHRGWPGDPLRYSWKDPKTGESTGMLLTGDPLSREQLPEMLFHVTTNAPAVESSGVLLGQLGDTGLGGGQAPGVSFTSSREDATIIQRELRRSVEIARGDVDTDAFDRYAREDEKSAGLPEGSLTYAANQAKVTWEGNKFTIENEYVSGEGYTKPRTAEERERIRRSILKDAFNSYLWSRETASEKAAGQPVPSLKNPILFGRQEHLAKLKPEDIQTLEIPSVQIPEAALVTTGSDKFLHEVRAYSDVPLRRRVQSVAKGEYVSCLKFNPNHDAEGKFSRVLTAITGVEEFRGTSAEELKREPLPSTLAAAEDRIRHEIREHAYVVRDGKPVAVLGNDDPHHVVMPKDMGPEDLVDAVLTHNHPSGYGLSNRDGRTAALRNVLEMRAVTTTGTHVIRRQDTTWPQNFGEHIDNLHEDLMDEISDQLATHAIDIAEANRLHHTLMYQRLQQKIGGFTYTFEPHHD